MPTNILLSSESNEWYTPPKVIDLARQVLEEIDLDPASNPIAQRWIKAKRFYTSVDDGIQHRWTGRLWLNPPYGQRSKTKGIYGASVWIEKALAEYQAGNVTSAILLVRGDSEGLKTLRKQSVFCLPFTRIAFWKEDGQPKPGPVPGSEIHYLGNSPNRFADVFCQFGDIFSQYKGNHP